MGISRSFQRTVPAQHLGDVEIQFSYTVPSDYAYDIPVPEQAEFSALPTFFGRNEEERRAYAAGLMDGENRQVRLPQTAMDLLRTDQMRASPPGREAEPEEGEGGEEEDGDGQ